MYDSMTAEVEVLDFLKAIVTTLKPELIVETGTFSGLSTLRLAEGLRSNGFGRVVTCEYDAKVFAAAKQRFAASGFAEWIDARNESSLEMKVEGRIDLLFCDSDAPLREQEVRKFLSQMNPYGLILMHDASSLMKTVREAALKLEAWLALGSSLAYAAWPRHGAETGRPRLAAAEKVEAGVPTAFAAARTAKCRRACSKRLLLECPRELSWKTF